MFEFEITDSSAVDAFDRFIAFGEDPSGALAGIGEVVMAFTKALFETSTDPYGEPWEPNSDTTLRKMLHDRSGTFTKKGKVSTKGEAMLSGKRPLIGETRALSTQFHSTVISESVVVSSSMAYAAMQNFGGSKAAFPHLWGDIPARPFFPDEARGLPEELDQQISEVLRSALQAALDGN